MIDTATAGHEAAHLVVGLALGLRLRRATIVPSPHGKRGILCGYVWFYSDRKFLAQAVMLGAGVAWDLEAGFTPDTSPAGDRASIARLVSKGDVDTCVRLAHDMLRSRKRIHARLASELCERDLTALDIAALVMDP